MNLKEELEKGFKINTFKSVVNSKGKRIYFEECTSLDKVKKLLTERDKIIQKYIHEFVERLILDNIYHKKNHLSINKYELIDLIEEILGKW